MTGDILVIDCVATNRIVLKVKLLAAQYRVRPCAGIPEAKVEIAAALPDLIILDTCTDNARMLEFCRHLKAQDNTCHIPIIATGAFTTPQDRVAALKAGADDVLPKPFDDYILKARIRSLLRSRDARLELRMREGTRTALGFAEATSDFAPPARIVFAMKGRQSSAVSNALRHRLPNCALSFTTFDGLSAEQDSEKPADLYVIDFRSGLTDDKILFGLLSELRSRSSTRHAGILALLPSNARQAAAMALDLGANDIVAADVAIEEVQLRCNVLIQAKHEADALRRTVENGLQAAITDPLTGLFNRRYALPHLARLSRECRKNGRQFAVMMLDLDHFKKINDTYGHKAGDDVLKQVAARLQGNLRAVDLLARMGGEEFLVAIPNSNIIHARSAAERLCKLISGTPFFVGEKSTELHITMSVGVSLNNGQEAIGVTDDLEDLVNAADMALYAAKSGGRNMVSLSAA